MVVSTNETCWWRATWISMESLWKPYRCVNHQINYTYSIEHKTGSYTSICSFTCKELHLAIWNNMYFVDVHSLLSTRISMFLLYPHTIPPSTSGLTTSMNFRPWINRPNHTLQNTLTKLLIMKFSTNTPCLCKAKVKQSLDRPWGLQEVEAPRFQDNRHMKVVRTSVLFTGRL
jgi:hypothetical protein